MFHSPAVIVEHKLVTPATADHHYPNHALVKVSRAEPFD